MVQRARSFLLITVIWIFFLSAGRISLFFFNTDYFKNCSTADVLWNWFAGLRFDLATVSFAWLVPVVLVFINDLLPLKEKRKYYYVIWSIIFFSILFITYLFEWIDAGYFRFIHHRSTKDLFFQLGGQTNVMQLLPFLWKDFTWLWIFLFLSVFLSFYLIIRFRWMQNFFYGCENMNTIQKLLFLPLFAVIFFPAFRGFSRIPLDTVDALKYTQPEQLHLVLNSTFSIIKSFEKNLSSYFKNQKPESSCSPGFKYIPAQNALSSFKQKNIIVIILEGISKEYTSLSGDSVSYTPFLDSLMQHSMVFTMAYSNGYKSIEGIPAILSSLPTLMDDPILNSEFNHVKSPSFASLLKRKGYYCVFMHGGYNGTMNFDAYARQASYDAYYGYDEFPDNKKNDDGAWGIWDEEFLRFAGKTMNRFPEPFHVAIFTLSSHHPFRIPEKYTKQFKKGKYENLESVQYTDMSLKKFFYTCRSSSWFRNSLFIITSDHTSLSQHTFYSNIAGSHSIPFIIYDPEIPEHRQISKTVQQSDILAITMDYIHYPDSFYSMGISYKDSLHPGGAFFYSSGMFYGICDSIMCRMKISENDKIEFFDLNGNPSPDSLYADKKKILSDNLKKYLSAYSCLLYKGFSE